MSRSMSTALCLGLLLWCPLGYTARSAETPTYTTIINHGPPSEKLDLVILGDGYRSSELIQYQADAQGFVDHLFTQPPFSQYQRFFNVHRVDVISEESGTDDHCRSTLVKTALDTGFFFDGVDCVLLFTYNVGKVNAAAAVAPASDVVAIIVNTLQFGGGAAYGKYALSYRLEGFGPEIMAHELGHSLGLLADEYETGGPTTYKGGEPHEPNVTTNTDRATLKWRDWVDPTTPFPTLTRTPDTPGLYQGAKYSSKGIYRPTYNSKMRSLGVPFERVNHSLLVDRIFDYLPPDTSPPSASLDINGACDASVSAMAVSVNVTASDAESHVLAYRLSHSADFSQSPWIPASNQESHSSIVPWTLTSGDGVKMVSVQVRNGYGLLNSTSCSIRLDTTPPSVPGTPTTTSQGGGTVTISWAESTDAGSGIS